MADLKTAPAALKAIQPYLKIAKEHDARDPAIAYWSRYYAVQYGLKINDKTPESTGFLISIMDWLENVKKTKSDDETISNDVVAQAHVENYALKLFLWADGEDRAGKFGKNVVKAFYTAGFLYDVVNTFGEPSEEVLHHRKYAKWKSTYIHNCLKNGVTPTPGPVGMEFEEDADENLESQEMNMGSHKEQVHPQEPQAPYPVDLTLRVLVPKSQMATYLSSQSLRNPAVLNNPLRLPSLLPQSDLALTMKDFHKVQKLCKTAESALRYEDVPSAIQYLKKALNLLTTGKEE
ncbi:vacuolar protein sorting-associated protein VTA1 homolog [Uloborus diversus]|uniref:vacuolar protein sorting-associated protein VTA1 homolog n=1 Tax=Uloborus diversus TaxID=327109 RepID=UPI00240A8ADF|nr:vacuolar protein sorting-associated protein VTA1 homolog [Uloborus diversus]